MQCHSDKLTCIRYLQSIPWEKSEYGKYRSFATGMPNSAIHTENEAGIVGVVG